MEWIVLSMEQEKAVQCISGPVLVSAGAGSGKTRTLTAKIAYLVRELGYSPERILGITFTNKAANEMKSRLEKMTGWSQDAFPWVRTFHSACFRILKRECEHIGLKRPLSVRTESNQTTLLKKIFLEFNVDRKYLHPVRSVISRAKNSGFPEKYLQEENSKIPHIIPIYQRYNELLREQNSVDFDDILLLVRDLLRTKIDLRKYYQELFDYILIDEFQDSNRLQNDIMELLVRDGNLMVVGDDYQSIYNFRGAEPRFFLSFSEKFPGSHVFKLEQNYRSTSPIVAASNSLISHNQYKLEKHCFSVKEGPSIMAKECFDEYHEAEWIADTCISYFREACIPWQDMAVLYRTRFCSHSFEEIFRRKRVPYKIMGARGFYESKEVQDINTYLMSAVNLRDDVAFERILNVPRRGIGSSTIKKIQTFKMPGMSFQELCWMAVQSGSLSKRVATELAHLKDCLGEIAKSNPKDAISIVLQEMGYQAYLEEYSENSEDFLNRMENIELLIYIASQKNSIEDYLEESALVSEDQDESRDNVDGVRLMTFHAAKGLEFRVVFIACLEEGLIPHWRSVLDGDTFKENIFGIEEERRLLYVGMTRAVERLHFTWSLRRQGKFTEPSRFIEEIPRKYMIVEKIVSRGRNNYGDNNTRKGTVT